jgi:ribonucleoside-diphosphate reductase alpha chain
MIDNVIEIMDYPFKQLEHTAKARRSIGVGITNLAYDMANKGYKYSTLGGKRYIHRLAEMHSYYLHKASLRLAKERGVCKWMSRTKYPEGWLPVDTANKAIDGLVNQPLMFDWEALRKEIIENGGIRNSVLEAFMPNESSSLATGGTNSIYPVRALKVIKTSGTNKNLFIAPKAEELKWDDELAWDVPTNDMLEVYAVVQKFTGQAISADLYISYSGATGEKAVGAKELLTQFLYLVKLGLKTRYYLNSSTSVSQEESKCSSGGCTL